MAALPLIPIFPASPPSGSTVESLRRDGNMLTMGRDRLQTRRTVMGARRCAHPLGIATVTTLMSEQVEIPCSYNDLGE